MGRSGNQRNMAGVTIDEISTISAAGASSVPVFVHQREENIDLETFVDSLYEKRSKIREDGLKGLLGALKSNVLTEFVDSKYETLLHLCISSLKKGESSEIMYACQVIGLIAVTIGSGELAQQILSEASSHLIKAAKLGSDSRARIAAMKTLALVCFVGSSSEETTESFMSILWQICKHKGNYHSDQTLGMIRPSSDVKAVALSAWAFLLVDIPKTRIISHHMSECLPFLMTFLENEDLAVRISAGEAIAALFEARNTLKCEYTAPYDNFTSEGLSTLCIEQVKGVAFEAGGKGHANKKSQRSSFRDILSIIEGRAVSFTPLKLHKGDVFLPDSWAQRTQLKFLTGVLAEGLQKHFQENSLLHQVFGFVPRQEKPTLLTSKEKRMYMSPNSIQSKERTQMMNHFRSQSYACQVGHFMFETD